MKATGRPRNMKTRQTILETALRIAEHDGFQALTIERISKEACVGKPTIYRWWSSKGAIVLEALQQIALETLPLPEAGTFKTRLICYLQAVFHSLRDGLGDILKSLVAEAQRDPAFEVSFRQDFIAMRREPVLTLLNDGIAQGELPADCKIEMLADLIFGALWYRLLITHAPLDDQFAQEIVDIIF